MQEREYSPSPLVELEVYGHYRKVCNSLAVKNCLPTSHSDIFKKKTPKKCKEDEDDKVLVLKKRSREKEQHLMEGFLRRAWKTSLAMLSTSKVCSVCSA